MARAWIPGAFALATVLMVARAPRADAPQFVERVVGSVDGRPILASELLRRAAPQERALSAIEMPEWRRAPLRRRLLRDVLERIVEERLIANAARAQGLEARQTDVDAAIDRIALDQGLTRGELELAVVAQGWLLHQYRTENSAQILEGWMLARWLSARGVVPRAPEARAKERKRWINELKRQAYVELRLSR
jgi:peptidyl-prolyl cis-trans isomerase SurA